jgi:hypothetical protein
LGQGGRDYEFVEVYEFQDHLNYENGKPLPFWSEALHVKARCLAHWFSTHLAVVDRTRIEAQRDLCRDL